MGWYESRLEKLRNEMEKAHLNVLFLFKPQNTFYVSDFNALIYSREVVAVIPLKAEPAIVIPRLRHSHALEESKIRDVRVYHKIRVGELLPGMYQDPMRALKQIVKDRKLSKLRIGIDLDYLSLVTYGEVRKTFPGAKLNDVSKLIDGLRLIKDEEEIDRVRKASKLAAVGLEAEYDVIRKRGTEIEASVAGMNAMNNFWRDHYPTAEVADFGGHEAGQINGLQAFSLVGKRGLGSAESPSSQRYEEGEVAWQTNLTVYNGYHSELERTVCIGQPSSRVKQGMEAHIEAREAVIEAMRPGATMHEVAEVAAKIFRRTGYMKYIHARVGHSIGLGGHEGPSFMSGEKTVLEPGMIMTVEPAIADPEVGSINHSDTVLVTKDKAERLTEAPSGLIVM